MTLRSFAKLNLFLEILSKRKDGYHNIRTLFERIDLSDKIILKSLPDKQIKIISHSPAIPKDKTNLAYQSAKLLQDFAKTKQGAEIKIIKHIPVASGLAGGSSNAATTLIGLNKLWKLNLSRPVLLKLARKVGADVGFFIYNCPFALGKERGDKITILRRFNKLRLWHILVVPDFKVSTPLAYKKWDEFSRLTPLKSGVKIAFPPGKLLFNRLEEVTLKLYPSVKRLKERLKQLGLSAILMSGSGPAVFGIVSSRKEAASLSRQLKKAAVGKVFVARTA